MTRKLAFLWIGLILFLTGIMLRFSLITIIVRGTTSSLSDIADIIMMSAAIMMILSFTRLTDSN